MHGTPLVNSALSLRVVILDSSESAIDTVCFPGSHFLPDASIFAVMCLLRILPLHDLAIASWV